MLKNILNSTWYWVILLVCIGILGFGSRWIFSYHYDSTYFNDVYDHSQWRIPLSDRIIGDNDLYLIAGERILLGQDFFGVAPEVPPLFKYIFGLSIQLSPHPFYLSIILYLLTAVLVWELGALLKVSLTAKRFSLLLFVISPLMSAQVRQTALDLPLLFLLLTHFVFFMKFLQVSEKFPRIIFFSISVLSLGFFSATKFPLFVPLILMLNTYYLWKEKKLMYAFLLIMGVGMTYVFSYLPYFFQGHSVPDWIATQKWMLHFYSSSKVSSTPVLSALSSIALGFHHGWWSSNSWQRITEWSLLWPAILLLLWRLKFSAISFFRSKQSSTSYLLATTSVFLALMMLVPFWPRYFLIILIPVLPLLAKFLLEKPRLATAILLVVCFQWLAFLFPQPNVQLKVAVENWSTTNYQDLYTHLDAESKTEVSRTTFLRFNKRADQDLKLSSKRITLNAPLVWPWQSETTAIFTETLTLPFGEQTFTRKVKLKREQGLWKINWDWQLVAPGFEPGFALKVEEDFEKLGTLYTLDKRILVQSEPWPTIIASPSAWTDSEAILVALQDLSTISKTSLEYETYIKGKGLEAVQLGLVKANDRAELQQALNAITTLPGVATGAGYKRVYQLPNQAIIAKAEQSHPELQGRLGGSVYLIDDSGMKTLLWQFPSILPQDVVLEQSTSDFL